MGSLCNTDRPWFQPMTGIGADGQSQDADRASEKKEKTAPRQGPHGERRETYGPALLKPIMSALRSPLTSATVRGFTFWLDQPAARP